MYTITLEFVFVVVSCFSVLSTTPYHKVDGNPLVDKYYNWENLQFSKEAEEDPVVRKSIEGLQNSIVHDMVLEAGERSNPPAWAQDFFAEHPYDPNWTRFP